MKKTKKSILKYVFYKIPYKKQLFTALKKVWTPPLSVYQHLYFNDVIEVKLAKDKGFKIIHHGHTIENELFWRGIYNSWEKYSLLIWTQLCKEANVIFDIGANTGIYSLIAKTQNSKASVHAFEPFPAICDKLVSNSKINNFDIHCSCTAISNYTGNGVIYTQYENFAYSVTVNQNLWVTDKEPIKLNIKTVTLKDYIEQNKITGIDLMKIDVETHEPEVMEGFEPYIENFRPVILIEILNDEVALKLSNYFNPKEYSFYDIDEEVGIKKSDSLTFRSSFNYLIIPKEKEGLLNGIQLLKA